MDVRSRAFLNMRVFNGKEVKMKERVYKILIGRYQNQMEDALVKIDMLLTGDSHAVMVQHADITGEIDKLLEKVASAEGKMATLRRFYGTN